MMIESSCEKVKEKENGSIQVTLREHESVCVYSVLYNTVIDDLLPSSRSSLRESTTLMSITTCMTGCTDRTGMDRTLYTIPYTVQYCAVFVKARQRIAHWPATGI